MQTVVQVGVMCTVVKILTEAFWIVIQCLLGGKYQRAKCMERNG